MARSPNADTRLHEQLVSDSEGVEPAASKHAFVRDETSQFSRVAHGLQKRSSTETKSGPDEERVEVTCVLNVPQPRCSIEYTPAPLCEFDVREGREQK